MYIEAVRKAFDFARVDYAMQAKSYANPVEGKGAQRRYSPAVCTGAVKERRVGRPDMISSRPLMSSARTLRCGCRCAGSRG